MAQTHHIDEPVGVDERWMSEWIAFGLADAESYLRKHAAFERYLANRRSEQLRTSYDKAADEQTKMALLVAYHAS